MRSCNFCTSFALNGYFNVFDFSMSLSIRDCTESRGFNSQTRSSTPFNSRKHPWRALRRAGAATPWVGDTRAAACWTRLMESRRFWHSVVAASRSAARSLIAPRYVVIPSHICKPSETKPAIPLAVPSASAIVRFVGFACSEVHHRTLMDGKRPEPCASSGLEKFMAMRLSFRQPAALIGHPNVPNLCARGTPVPSLIGGWTLLAAVKREDVGCCPRKKPGSKTGGWEMLLQYWPSYCVIGFGVEIFKYYQDASFCRWHVADFADIFPDDALSINSEDWAAFQRCTEAPVWGPVAVRSRGSGGYALKLRDTSFTVFVLEHSKHAC